MLTHLLLPLCSGPCKRLNPVSSCCTNCPAITARASPSLFCHGNRILLCSSCRAAHGTFALSRSHPRPHINRRAGCTVLRNSLLCNLCSPACCSVGLAHLTLASSPVILPRRSLFCRSHNGCVRRRNPIKSSALHVHSITIQPCV